MVLDTIAAFIIMKARLRPYPHFEIDRSVSGFQNINRFTVDYFCTLFQNLLIMEVPQALDKLAVHIKSMQVKLEKREIRISNLIKFHLNQGFANYKSMRYSRMMDERSTIGFVSRGNLTLMAPIVEMIVTRSQLLETSHEIQIQRIDEQLKALAHRNDSYTSDNPLFPINLLNIFVSSIDSNSFSIYEIKDFFFLVCHEFYNQLEDFYNQIEFGANSRLKETEAMPLDLDLSASDTNQLDHTVAAQAPKFAQQGTTGENKHQILFAIRQFKIMSQSGYLNHDNALRVFCLKIGKFLQRQQKENLQRYNEFITSILSLEELSENYRNQIASFSWRLVLLALFDHHFLDYEFHPVYLLIESATDYELLHGHDEADFAYLTNLISQVLQLKTQALADYQKIFESYETRKIRSINKSNHSSGKATQSESDCKFRLIQLTEEITEDLILDDELMVFFFDDWQKWLRHLASQKGIESSEVSQAIEIMKKIALILEGNLQLKPDDYTALEKYIESAWLLVELPKASRDYVNSRMSKKITRTNSTGMASNY